MLSVSTASCMVNLTGALCLSVKVPFSAWYVLNLGNLEVVMLHLSFSFRCPMARSYAD